MTYGTVNADVIATSTPQGILGAGNASIMKNRIINGAMVIDQRNSGASVSPYFSYTLDRWYGLTTQTSKFTVQQNAGSVTLPVGFSNYLGITSSSAYSVLTADTFAILQKIEGYNISDLGWGTANAKTVTLSFQVYSSLTGTFGGALQNSASNRSYPFTFTASSANTWTSVSVTISGDTAGTWLTTNGVGIQVVFGLGSGSTYSSGTANIWSSTNTNQPTGTVSIVGTSGATFYITGVQLEVGSSATGYEYRQYQQELALCQRYCFVAGGNPSGANPLTTGLSYSTSASNGIMSFPVTMRAAPTMTYGTVTDYQITNGAGTAYTTSNAGNYVVSNQAIELQFNVASAVLTQGQASLIRSGASTGSAGTGKITASAEL